MSPFEVTSASLIHLAVESLASSARFTPAQKKTRTEAVICATMAFLPTEPVQTMLATQAVGHHFTLLDTFREINDRALTETGSVRMRMVSATQTRMMLELVREVRVVRKHSLAAAEAEQNEMQAARAPQPEQAPAPRDDSTFETNMRAFEKAVTATAATVEQARTLDGPTAEKARRILDGAFAPNGAANGAPNGAPSGAPAGAKTNGHATPEYAAD